ncbi:MAG: ABC transporter permease [Terrimicrobiaceae bacterium]|nr:ABC transporter permease [Terrimicrobiaceae bacterium]
MWRCRELSTVLAIRDTKAKYRGSLLGIIWAVVPPLLAAVGLSSAKSSGMLNLGEAPIPFAAFVVFGCSLWQIFASALMRPIQAFSASRHLLTKINFPREALLASEFWKLLGSVGVHLVLVAVVFGIYRVPLEATAPLVVLPLAALVAFGFGLGLLISPAALLLGDVSNALPFLTGALFIVTPVVYSVPQGKGLFAMAVRLNPLSSLFEGCRELISHGLPTHPMALAAACGLAIIVFVAGLVVSRASMPLVVERWSA